MARRVVRNEAVVLRSPPPPTNSPSTLLARGQEMVGKAIWVQDSAGTWKQGTLRGWEPASLTAKVSLNGRTISVGIARLDVRPTRVSGVAYFHSNLDGQRTAVEQAARRLADFEKRRPEFERARNLRGFEAERSRLAGLLADRTKLLGVRLVQDFFLNRYDQEIANAVSRFNQAGGARTPAWPKLEANLVKSILYQESKLNIEPARGLASVTDSPGIAQYRALQLFYPTSFRDNQLAAIKRLFDSFGPTGANVVLKELQASGAVQTKPYSATFQALSRTDQQAIRTLLTKLPSSALTAMSQARGNDAWLVAATRPFFTRETAQNTDSSKQIQMLVGVLLEKLETSCQGSSDFRCAVRNYNGSPQAASYLQSVWNLYNAARTAGPQGVAMSGLF